MSRGIVFDLLMFSSLLLVALGLLEYNANGRHAAAAMGLFHPVLEHRGFGGEGR
jgi:hypothetical protein